MPAQRLAELAIELGLEKEALHYELSTRNRHEVVLALSKDEDGFPIGVVRA
jgi:hypothetical protein